MPIQLPLGLIGAEQKRQQGIIADDQRQRALKAQQEAAAAAAEDAARANVEQQFRQMMTGPMKDLGKSRLTVNDPDLLPKPVMGAGGVGGPEGSPPDRKAILQAELRKARLKAELEKARGHMEPGGSSAWENRFAKPAEQAPETGGVGLMPGGAPKWSQTYQPPAPFTGQEYDDQAKTDLGLKMFNRAESQGPSGAQAAMANFYNTATFGQGDKLRGLAAQAMGGNYDEEVARSRDWLQRTHSKEPGWSTVGDVGGFLVPGSLAFKAANALTKGAVQGITRAAPALGFTAKTVDLGLKGAASGGLYGFTTAAENEAINMGHESPDILAPERFANAQAYGMTGAALGAAMPAAGVITRPARNFMGGVAARAIEPFAPGAIAKHNLNVGAAAARRSFERAGILTLDDFMKRAAKYGDKPVVAGELGQDPLNSLVALVRGKGTSGEKAMAVLEDRVSGMPGRLLKDIADETGLKPDEVMGQIEDMVKAGRARAAPLYDDAEATPFAPSPNLDRIMQAPLMRSLLGKAENRVANQAAEPYISSPEGMPPIKVYDEVKQLLDEEINRRLAVGEGIDDVEALRSALVRELDIISAEGADYAANAGVSRQTLGGAKEPIVTQEERDFILSQPHGSEPRIPTSIASTAPARPSIPTASPANNHVQLTAPKASPYALAREAGGDAPRVQAGLKAGEKALSGAQLADDVGRQVAALTGQELTAYQIGVIRNMVKGVENGTLTPKRVRAMGFQKKLKEVFGEPAANGLIRKFGIEAELSQKGARWNPNVGSVTSQAMMGGPSRALDNAINVGAAAARGDKIGVASQVFNMLRRQGYSENQLNAIGDIMLSSPDDAAKALFPGKTPTPGAIPPPIPPAGRLRQNPHGGVPAPPRNALSIPAPLARDLGAGAVGATVGAATTPEGEDPMKRALTYGAAAGLGTRIASGLSRNMAIPRAQTNAFFPPPKGFRSGRKPYAPRDIVLGYNDGDSFLDMGLDLGEDMYAAGPQMSRKLNGKPELAEGDITNRLSVYATDIRNMARQAQADGKLDDLANQWNVTPDELNKFISMRPRANAGQFEQTITSIVDMVEKSAKAGRPLKMGEIAERIGSTEGSVKAMLSQAKNGKRPISPDLQARLNAMPRFPRGRPDSFSSLQSPPELGGAMVGGVGGYAAPIDSNGDGQVTDEDRRINAMIGAAGGVIGGRMSRGRRIDPTRTGSFGGSVAKKPPEMPQGGALPNFIEDATDENMQKMQLDMIGRGEVPPVFKTFRLPNGRIIAWNGDESRGGFGHDQAREILGLGNMRLEHGQSYLGGPPLSKTNWYSVSGEGQAPRSVETMVRQGAKQGREPGDAIQDAYPHEIERDLRGIGAMGPGDKAKDYSHRRKLALATKVVDDAGLHAITWKTDAGKTARLAFGPGGAPGSEMIDFRLSGRTSNLEGMNSIPTSEAKALFEKAASVVEREVIRRGKDIYSFSGATPAHNRLYAGTLQRLGTPQGYLGILDKRFGNFALIKQSRFDADVKAGRIDPKNWTIIQSKRGSAPVPDWRRVTGQFAIPAAAGGAMANALSGPRTNEPRSK